ncbi:MAG: hypothetical protein Greene041679_153 [Parcubacteria group bacterium Greene0416_79]|nr:MAG: hypothetical protein Greene041679_153 [Parcubacteria group bacterium Greene0416_79]
MNKELAEVLKIYSTDTHERFASRLFNSSKETLVSLFTDLLTTYINDHNSSKLREYLTVTVAGYEHSEGKIGFNGYKQSSIIGGAPIACEAKPKNFNTDDLQKYQEGTRRGKPATLNGNGNFTDYTYPRFKKDKKENPHILVSGFVDGRLIYILEFPFAVRSFSEKLERQLRKQFPDGRHIKGRYLRSASFTFKDYISSRDLKVIFLLSKVELERFREYISKKFFHALHEKSN